MVSQQEMRLIRQQISRQTEAYLLRQKQETWDYWKDTLEGEIRDYRKYLAVTVGRLKKLDDEGGPKSLTDRKKYEAIEEVRESNEDFLERAEKKLKTWLENNPRPVLEQ